MKTSAIEIEQGRYPNVKKIYRIHRDTGAEGYWYSIKWGWTKTTGQPLKRVTTFGTRARAQQVIDSGI